MNCLCILDTKPSSVTSFTNIFSYSIRCLFFLSMVSFSVQKLLSLIRPCLFIFTSVSFTLGDRSKKYCYNLCQRVFCLCFFTRRFMISSLAFRSLIHFEFILYMVWEFSNFILSHVPIQFSQCWLLNRLSFFHCTFLWGFFFLTVLHGLWQFSSLDRNWTQGFGSESLAS